MSIKQKAKELAITIKESDEFQKLKSAEARLSLDPTAQDLLQELSNKQQLIITAQQTGRQLGEQEIRSVELVQQQIKLNTTLQAIFKAQQQLEKVLEEVNETISQELAK